MAIFALWLVWQGGWMIWLISDRGKAAPARAICANNLKQIGMAFSMYSNDSRWERFPSLSPEPGQLFADYRVLYPKYIPDPVVTICPKDEIRKELTRMRQRQAEDWTDDTLSRFFDDHSYYYLGYAVLNDEDVESFARRYAASMRMHSSMTEDIEVSNYQNPGKTRRLFCCGRA